MGVPLSTAADTIVALLKTIQANLFAKAKAFRDANTHEVNSWDEFTKTLEAPGGFLLAHWDGTRETEDKISELTKATIRCIPYGGDTTPGLCVLTGKPSARRVVFAKSY